MEREFLPLHYSRVQYLKLQGLRQGTRSTDEYSNEFYTLISQLDLRETPKQLVTWYIAGLKYTFQDTLTLFAPRDVGESHQQALLLEKQFAHRPPLPGNHAPPASVAAFSGASSSTQRPSVAPSAPAALPQISAVRCFGCGDVGHRQAACPKAVGRVSFREGFGTF